MKKMGWLVALLAGMYTTNAQTRSLTQLLGSWEAVDSENSSGGLEVKDSSTIFLVWGTERKPVSSYKADFSKSPCWFDFTIKDSTETITVTSLLQFVNDDLVQWQVFQSDKRPDHFTQGDGEMLYLRRKK